MLHAQSPIIINALNSGVRGYEVADHLCGLLGTGTHAAISAFGQDQIVTGMLQLPQIALFGEPRLRTFTDEFIRYEHYLDNLEESPEETRP
jgi:hypothetical protein